MVENFTGLELQSTTTGAGRVELKLVEVVRSNPGPDQVIVQVEATPINPSDLFTLLARADLSTLEQGGTAERPTISASVSPHDIRNATAPLNSAVTPGGEGAGTVVAAGGNAKHLLGKRVAIRGGGMYTQYRTLPASDCVVLPEGATAVDGASIFVNPPTALCFLETMRIENHSAMVHFAAASNLGQMLNKLCLADGIPLVNVVRSEEQVALMRSAGAEYVINSQSEDFEDQLTDAVAATGATLAFDPIGGGRQATQAIAAMERAARAGSSYSRYGTDVFKQVYIYGTLDVTPTVLDHWVGFAWAVGGWLVSYRMQQIGPEGAARLQARILDELKTTFASKYTASLSLKDALRLENVQAYARRATGEKYLITPIAV